jgi:enolase
MNTKIKKIIARQIIDCKCRPAVEVDVITEDGSLGRGCAPTGLSVGMYESFILRDDDPKEYHGLSVHKAVENVEKIIAPALIGMDVTCQRELDEKMIALDGTSNKSKLGGNAIYSTSIACFRAAAECFGLPLYEYIAKRPIKTVPIPTFNVINGGHYDNITLAFNEFILIPYKACSIYEAVEIGVNTFQELAKVLHSYLGREPEVAHSYGYAAPSDDPEVVLGLMQKAVDACGYHGKVAFALDCASSEMYDDKTKTYLLKGKRITSDEMIDYAKSLSEKFNLVFIEDLLDENDWDGYVNAVQKINRTLIIGDDLTVTNPARIKKAYDTHAVHGFILKPNQVGTITEALDAYNFAREHGMLAITSGRSGGVIGDIVMDLAVGLEIGFVKNGAPRSGERIDKLNFLMRACDLTPGCELADITNIIKF